MPGIQDFPNAFRVNGHRQWAWGFYIENGFHFSVQAGTLAQGAQDYAQMPSLCDASFTNFVPIQLSGFSQGSYMVFDHYGSRYDGNHHLVTDRSTVVAHVIDPHNPANSGYFSYHNAHDVDVASLFY